MKNMFALIAGCIVILHLFSLDASAQTVVQAVEIHGNKVVSAEKIRRIIGIEVGDLYDEKDATTALKRLFETKEFADVQVFKEIRDGDVALIFMFDEYTKVDEVRFEGNKHVKKDDLVEATVVWNYLPSEARRLGVDDRQVTFDVELSPGQAITGMVRSANGTPLVDAAKVKAQIVERVMTLLS